MKFTRLAISAAVLIVCTVAFREESINWMQICKTSGVGLILLCIFDKNWSTD